MTILAVAQMNSQNDVEKNFVDIEHCLKQAKKANATLCVFPENFICFAAGQQIKMAERFDEFKQRLEQLCFQYQIWMVAGTLACPYRPNGDKVTDGRVRTVSLCISPEGKTVARYDKIHLFDVMVSDGIGQYQESASFEAGDELAIAKTPFGNIGLMVCYDLRFPELAVKLRQKGANLLTAPSAFTFNTGQQHWQILLQARAIDSQCHILGAAQQGWHSERKRQTWGHAMITHSSGKILAECQEEGLQLITADFDLAEQEKIRQAMPLIQHRRLLQF
ncbi:MULTISPECIES: carbon-nitrogen hydrolase family protein [unclassified Acinetobacter]|uniref:carbon-nitrogen hydrolase family protein n=1 Tax=unclassified Acinetobacter TaxID=196816 RepID=UPI0035BB19FD